MRRRKIKNNRHQDKPIALMFNGSGYLATADDPGAGQLYWPSLNEADELTEYSLEKMWKKARALEANSGIAGILVDSVASLLGWLSPRAQSNDQTWNKQAEAVFLNRSLNPELFDVSAELNFFTAQLWMETRRSIDGDCLTVLTEAIDEGAGFAFYSAPHIVSPNGADPQKWQNGVRLNKDGRAVAYGIWDEGKSDAVIVTRRDAILYSHTPDPRRKRGLSDLRRAIRHIHDEAEILGLFKKSIKLASSVGLIETNENVGKSLGLKGVVGDLEPKANLERILGTKILKLDAGKDLKILNDNRPSTQSMDLVRHLLDECVYGIGIDPGVVFTPDRLGSAGVRWVSQKLKRWLKIRLEYRKIWANKIWRYTIAKEIKRGNLPAPEDSSWMDVAWIPMESMTIDVGRDGRLAMGLCQAGMADLDDWTLSTTGKTFEELIDKKAYHMAQIHKSAEKYGVSVSEVMPALSKVTPEDGVSPEEAESPAMYDGEFQKVSREILPY